LIKSQAIQETYDKFSSFYDLIFKPCLEKGRLRAMELLFQESCNQTLEIGVGTGLGLEGYPRSTKLTAFDYSHGMLKTLKKKEPEQNCCRFDLLQMDVQKMAFPDNTFDSILAAYVLTVVEKPEQALDEIFRVAKPGAKIVVMNYLRSQNRFVRILEELVDPLFTAMGLFSVNRDLLKLIKEKGAKNLKIEPTSWLNTHFIISFTTPRK
jgi:phosphatidylethanolamine/phosphatidyl-N-methylethanolamine N-methyltransferase